MESYIKWQALYINCASCSLYQISAFSSTCTCTIYIHVHVHMLNVRYPVTHIAIGWMCSVLRYPQMLTSLLWRSCVQCVCLAVTPERLYPFLVSTSTTQPMTSMWRLQTWNVTPTHQSVLLKLTWTLILALFLLSVTTTATLLRQRRGSHSVGAPWCHGLVTSRGCDLT